MRRSLSPILRRELKNLDKDANSRKSAMKALKSYVKDLDSKAIPLFLAQVSQTNETGASSGEYTISLYEVLARVHGPKIVPQIDNIVSTIIKTLSSSAGSFALHQACSKVLPAIARYSMDPTTPEDKKRYIIHSLCKPLSDCLLGSQENLSSGAALCLQALVECDNWRFASNEMVNEICQRVAGALKKHTQTNSHMALVTTLAKHNSLLVEAYARLLIHSGLQILNIGYAESNSQKQLSAIHMVSSLMRYLDPRSIFSELGFIIEEMEKCQSDRIRFVTGAAFEALQTAKRICMEKSTKFERDDILVTGSVFDGRDNSETNNSPQGSGEQSPLTASPESQTLDSFIGYDHLTESPLSVNQISQLRDYGRRSVNRKLWQKCESGGVDVSLKDGILLEVGQGSSLTYDNQNELSDDFTGFMQADYRNGVVRSTTPSPQRSRSHINVDDVKIFTTPRKLIRSLQDPNEEASGFSEKQSRRFRSPFSSKFEWTPMKKCEQNVSVDHMYSGMNSNRNISSGEEQFHGSSESVSSTGDALPDVSLLEPPDVIPVKQIAGRRFTVTKGYQKSPRKVIIVLFALLVALCMASLLLTDDANDHHTLVPT